MDIHMDLSNSKKYHNTHRLASENKMGKLEREIHRGEIYIARLDPVIGSEQNGTRPVLVIQNNIGNHFCPTLIVAPITNTYKHAELPVHYALKSCCLSGHNTVLLEQIKTIDKTRIIKFLGRISQSQIKDIDQKLKISLGLDHKGEKNDNIIA